jgi:hypothetical protein
MTSQFAGFSYPPQIPQPLKLFSKTRFPEQFLPLPKIQPQAYLTIHAQHETPAK